jgi:hypothetical protein
MSGLLYWSLAFDDLDQPIFRAGKALGAVLNQLVRSHAQPLFLE